MEKINIEKRILDRINIEYEKCIGCKLCMKGCPMLDKFCDSPKELLGELVVEGKVDYKLPYSCLLCGYCTKVCPKDVDLKKIFFQLRNNIVRESNGEPPKELGYASIKFHQKNSFSKLFSTDIKGLKNGTDIIFFPGCSLMGYSPEIVEKTYEYLKDNIPGIGIYIKCCGKPTLFMGDEKRFNKYYAIIEEDFERNNVKRIITACPNCFNTIKDTSKDIEVMSLWDVISDIGVPKSIKKKGNNVNISFSIHDPCPTRDETKTHNSIRNILDEIGLQYKESEFSREKTLCCGAGGMVFLASQDIATGQMKDRATELEEEHIITYCEECVQSMKTGGKKSFHVLDLLFHEKIYESFSQKDVSFIGKWINRYKGRTKIKWKNQDKEY